MSLNDLLKLRETAIINRWFDLIIDSYPADASGFLKNQKNRFLNPVGNIISREIGVLYRSLLTSADSGKLETSIENIIKIRSVQEFTPAQAVGFVFLIKRAIWEVLNVDADADAFRHELGDFYRRVDELALKCFDCYTRCRERIYEVRLNELRRRSKIVFFSNKQTAPLSE